MYVLFNTESEHWSQLKDVFMVVTPEKQTSSILFGVCHIIHQWRGLTSLRCTISTGFIQRSIQRSLCFTEQGEKEESWSFTGVEMDPMAADRSFLDSNDQ